MKSRRTTPCPIDIGVNTLAVQRGEPVSRRSALIVLVAVTAALLVATGSPSSATTPPHLVKDINTKPVPGTGGPDSAVRFAGALWFSGDDGVHGRELWRSDGTPDGTSMFADVWPGPSGSWPGTVPVLRGGRRRARRRAVAQRRHAGRYLARQGPDPGRRLVPSPGVHQRGWAPVLRHAQRGDGAPVDQRRHGSRDDHAADLHLRGGQPHRPVLRPRIHAVLRRGGRPPRAGAVEERRDEGRDGPLQGPRA